LHSLALNIGGADTTFYPTFSATTLAYNVNIGQGETAATATVSTYKNAHFLATASLPAGTAYVGLEAMASMTVQDSAVVNNGNSVAVTSSSIILGSPSTVISIKVTAQDGTHQTYTVTVSRIGLTALTTTGALTFNPTVGLVVYSYTLTAPNTLSQIALTPTAPCLAAGCTIETMSVDYATDGNSGVSTAYTTVTSGSASIMYPLSEGNTTIFRVKVTDSHNTALVRTYEVAVHRQPSADDTLLSLTSTGGGVLSPTFDASHTSYGIAVGNAVTSISLTPTMSRYVCCNTAEGIEFDNSTGVWSQHTYWGTNSQAAPTPAISLVEGGVTTVNFKVTAQDGASVLNYKIEITRAKNDDKTLHTMVAKFGSGRLIYPVFNPTTLLYMLNVDEDETYFDFTATAYSSLNGLGPSMPTTDSSGTDYPLPSGKVYTGQSARSTIHVDQDVGQDDYLDNGSTRKIMLVPYDRTGHSGTAATTTTLILVTAQDGSFNTYSITVNRIGLSDLHTTSMTMSTFTPPAGPWSTPGTATTDTLVLVPTYSPVITGLNANFDRRTLSYEVTAPNNVESIKFNATGLATASFAATQSFTITITSNDPTDIRGHTPTTPITTVTNAADSGALHLSEGVTTNFTIKVTDVWNSSTFQIYNINVKRIGWSCQLSSLTVSTGSLVPSFSTYTTSYTMNEINSVNTITLTAIAEVFSGVTEAIVKMNGTVLPTGIASDAIVLKEGPGPAGGTTTVEVTATAQIPTYTKAWQFTIIRAPSTDATLSSLVFTGVTTNAEVGTWNPMFTPSGASYTITLENSISNVTMTPTKNHRYLDSMTVAGVALGSTAPFDSKYY